MKVAVTSVGETVESPVDQSFGRASYFILYDTESGEWSAHDNKQNLEAAQGAGVQSGQKVVELGAEAVITGNCGPKAFATLMAGGIEIYQEAFGTVKEAIDAFEKGKLNKSGKADVEEGFGSV